MKKDADEWINRYVDAYMVVTRQINARLRDIFGEGLTTDQFLILRLISGQERCTSTYLAEAVAVGKSSITAIINRLDEAGMIQRTRDENDRRQVYLTMTEYGESVYKTSEMQMQQVISPYLFHFEDHNIELFITMFEKLAFLMQDTGGEAIENDFEGKMGGYRGVAGCGGGVIPHGSRDARSGAREGSDCCSGWLHLIAGCRDYEGGGCGQGRGDGASGGPGVP